MSVIGFHADTKIFNRTPKGVPIHLYTECHAFGQDVDCYGLTFDGEFLNTRVGKVYGQLDSVMLKLTLNDAYSVVLCPEQQLYNQHGVIYRAEELKPGQHLGGITPQMANNLRLGFDAKLHQCTGYFVVTNLCEVAEKHDSYSLQTKLGNYVLNCGLIARGAAT